MLLSIRHSSTNSINLADRSCADGIISLVFVHGLTGGSITTWIHENGQLWLNWLIDEMPYIRIFLYGYRAHQVYLKPENEEDRPSYGRLFTDAEDLCNALRDNRQRMEV